MTAGSALRALPPVRSRLTVASSHIVLTEPVPDVLEALGWTGGEAITDGHTLLHYMRTTPDGRIAYGWAGGRIACGGRLGGRLDVDPAVASAAERDLRATFPQLEGRSVTHAWGGPIDVSPTHLPLVGSLPGGRCFWGAGFTGNGVGPTRLIGQVLASLALDRRDERTRLPIVDAAPGAPIPPEPLAWAGGMAVRAALMRRERIEDQDGRVDPVTRTLSVLPKLLGVQLGR